MLRHMEFPSMGHHDISNVLISCMSTLRLLLLSGFFTNIALEVGFLNTVGLYFISYSSCIREFLKSLPIHYYPWSYIISVGQGYLYIVRVSNKFDISIAFLPLYCVTSNYYVT